MDLEMTVTLPYFVKDGHTYIVLGMYEREGYGGQRMMLDCTTTTNGPAREHREDVAMSRKRLNALRTATFKLTGEVK